MEMHGMRITLNGEAREVQQGTTIAMLVVMLSGEEVRDPRGVAIERNLEIVPKSEHATTVIEDGDRIEVVQFVGGG
jgi:sulfur carrier protein